MILKFMLAAFVLCSAVTAGTAATYTVTTTADSGPGSLRQAILDANASPAEDTINFGNLLFNRAFVVRSPLIITGDASNRLTIAGPPQLGSFNEIEISGNGETPIFVIQSGVVSISNVWIYYGRASGEFPSGGAIYSAATSLTLDGVSCLQNFASLDGGAIFVDAGTLTMKNSWLNGNRAGRSGGGLALDVDTSATITDSSVSLNALLPGGQMNDSGGGGIALAGGVPGSSAATLALANSSVRDNQTSDGRNGGGIAAGTGSVVTLDRAGLINNKAAGDGGGLASRAASLTISNSIIGGNSARTGGGIFRESDTESSVGSIVHSTVAKNTATVSGGGMAEGSMSPVSVRATIIADNMAPGGPDIFGSVRSQGYNLFESLAGAALTGTTAGNIVGLDPMLGPISGGNWILSLNEGSPAIDAGDPLNFTAADSRGRQRPWDGDGDGSWLPDIGATERALGTVQFGGAAALVLENIGGGLAPIAIRRDAADGDVTVQYTVANGSAVLGSDYQAMSGTFTFTGGATLGYIHIPIINDAIDEPNETIIVNLTSVTPGARIGSPATAVVTIVNDDLTISGRVTTPTGQGLRNATVQLINAQGAITAATTSSFGTYSFENVRAGESYTVRVLSKRYRFAPRSGAFQASATNIDFAALE